MIKRIIGILVSAYAVLLGIINYKLISSTFMINGDSLVSGLHPGSQLIFKICILFSAVMLLTGILLFFKAKFSMEMYFMVMLLFITTITYTESSIYSLRMFLIPAALGIILLLFSRKKAYAYNEVSNRRK
jgi:hypothetical protein